MVVSTVSFEEMNRIMGTEEFVYGCLWVVCIIFVFALTDTSSALLQLYKLHRIRFACDLRSVGETLPPCHWASCPAKEHCKYYQPTWVFIRNWIQNKFKCLKRQKGC